ncbi:MAG TPA: AHH domain-containing protein [Cellvibrio sp.]|nr:AHH domain-containing protein [Cellvibrio sp.]
MSQIGESIAVIPPGGKEKCCFCGKDHQQKKAAAKADFPRNMSMLKSQGRAYSIANYSGRYPGDNMAPLVEWQADITKTGGYKAAAHHCIALKSVSQHKISGELKAAGYDPNRGSNCSWLPYSSEQFSRARAYSKPLQKHRGGHTDAYFAKVLEHIKQVEKLIATDFCSENETASKQALLEYMEAQEKKIWLGIATASDNAYHLYNTSYLDPDADWGSFDFEGGRKKQDVVGSSIDPDAGAEAASADDPE